MERIKKKELKETNDETVLKKLKESSQKKTWCNYFRNETSIMFIGGTIDILKSPNFICKNETWPILLDLKSDCFQL